LGDIILKFAYNLLTENDKPQQWSDMGHCHTTYKKGDLSILP